MIFKTSNSPNYYLRLFRGGRDKWISLRTPHKKEAEMRAARIKYTVLPKLLKLSTDRPPIETGMIASEYIRSPEYRKLKDSTAEMNLLTLGKFLEYCKKHRIKSTRDITEIVTDEYMSSLKCAPKTYNNTKVTLGAIWRAINEDDVWRSVKNRPLRTIPMRGFTDKEIEKIFRAVAFDPFWRPACYLALYTGLRLADIVMLKPSQIKKDMKYIELRPSKTERTGRAVYIPIHPTLKTELKRIHESGDYLFPEIVSAYRTCRNTVSQQFARILRKAEIKRNGSGKAGFHSWRVTFAGRAQDNGISVETIRAVLGHTTKAMTAHYIDSPESLNLDALPEVKIG